MGNDMTTDELQKPMERLLNAVVEKAVTEGLELRRLRGVALYDSQKDSFIKALPEFVGGKGQTQPFVPIFRRAVARRQCRCVNLVRR